MLFAAWRIFFERIAEQGTTILLFEDLQWADSGLLDFIDQLLAWSRSSPILVVTLARPELFDRRPGWGAAARSLTTLALEPLSAEAMRELLDGFVPGLPETAVAAILGRADGIPLYAVETVRALVADGRLEMSDGGYRPVGDLATLAIPDTLRSLIASRLDALEPADRAPGPGGRGRWARPSPWTGWRQRPARSARRLAGRAWPRWSDASCCRWRPTRGLPSGASTRSSSRSSARSPTRRWPGATGATGTWPWPAGTSRSATRSSPVPWRPTTSRRTMRRRRDPRPTPWPSRPASPSAGRPSAPPPLGPMTRRSATFARRLEVTSDAAEQADLLLRAARSADLASRYTEAVEFAERGRQRLRGCRRPRERHPARAMLGAILLDASRIAEARTALEATLSDLDETVDAAVRAEVLSNLSRALMRSDETARAIEMADRALAIAERLDLELIVAEAFNNKGSSLGYLGRRREAVALLEAAVRVAQAGGFVGAELRALANLGAIVSGDDPRRAREVDREGLALARRVGHRMMANWLVGNVLIDAFTACDGWDVVVAEGEEALAAVTDPGDEQRITGLRDPHPDLPRRADRCGHRAHRGAAAGDQRPR